MGSFEPTPQQRQAMEDRGGSLLVSAAAGSGKTKVLVERLFGYMERERCRIDDFLIITYTKAAAAELRSKILTKIGSQIRIILQIGRLIAEGHQLSGACSYRHEVPQPDVPCAIQQRIGDIVRRQRREQRLCVGWIKRGEECGETESHITPV